MRLVVTVTDAPGPDATAVIERGLSRAVLVSNPDTREVIGGVLGRTSLGLCFIDLVFLPDDARGQSVGRRMMGEAEEEARRRHCRSVVLYTISFQAPDFYERLGYRRFGAIDCDPPGTSRIFFVKELT